MTLDLGYYYEGFDDLAEVYGEEDLGALRLPFGGGRRRPAPRAPRGGGYAPRGGGGYPRGGGGAMVPRDPGNYAPAPYQPAPPPAYQPPPYQPAPYYGNNYMPAARLIPSVPGAPAIGIRLQPLGFPTVAFTATSGTSLPTTSRPQRPFKPKRLSVDIARTGTTATGLVTVTELSIGTNNQFVSRQPIGATSFSPLAVDMNMELSASTTSLDITVGYAISAAPTMTDRVDIATTIMGESVGA